MGRGDNHIVAGLAAAAALPLGVFVLGLPLLLAVPADAAIYVGLALALAPRRRVVKVDFAKVDRAQAEFVGELIVEGEACVARLRRASAGLRAFEGRQTVDALADRAEKILERLAREPDKLPAVRRFLTYYLPRAAEIAEGLVTLERQSRPDPARRAEAQATLGRIGQAFGAYADGLDRSDLDALGVELKLVDRALAEDLGGTFGEARGAASTLPRAGES